MITAGLDLGTRTVKAVILSPEGMLASDITPVNDRVDRLGKTILKSARQKSGISSWSKLRVCATGYGRRQARVAHKTFPEDVCLARAIHYLGRRKEQPFIAENCGVFPDQLVENEFFGHTRGAYTDAVDSSDGVIAQAEGGTLFLDEIETLTPRGQTVLLRFLESMSYRQLGGSRARYADIRIIFATNENIPGLVERGQFRKDQRPESTRSRTL